MKNYQLIIPEDVSNKSALSWLIKTGIKALNLNQVEVVVAGKEDKVNALVLNFSTCFLAKPNCSLLNFSNTPFNFSEKGVMIHNNEEDLLTTNFYLINCIQEHNSQNHDELGRYLFKGSFQEKYKAYDRSFVTNLFEEYFTTTCPEILQNRLFEKSRIFFSHDIDSLHGAFLQDGLAALKKGRFDVIARLVSNVIFQKPDWFNIDQIAKIDSENDLRSTFFWIVNKGRVSEKLTNADYDINSASVQNAIRNVEDRGLNNGLHKSLLKESHRSEISKLPFQSKYNRTHYLRFQLPRHYELIEEAGLEVDCSLGFAEQYGFRNSLAIPFVPYNLLQDQAFHFLEVPLNLMDGTFQKYMSVSSNAVFDNMRHFIEKNSENAVISVLWHNHFFSSYRFSGFKKPYLDLVEYLKQKEFKAIDPQELYNKYYFSAE